MAVLVICCGCSGGHSAATIRAAPSRIEGLPVPQGSRIASHSSETNVETDEVFDAPPALSDAALDAWYAHLINGPRWRGWTSCDARFQGHDGYWTWRRPGNALDDLLLHVHLDLARHASNHRNSPARVVIEIILHHDIDPGMAPC
jgi:hypothetical protein